MWKPIFYIAFRLSVDAKIIIFNLDNASMLY